MRRRPSRRAGWFGLPGLEWNGQVDARSIPHDAHKCRAIPDDCLAIDFTSSHSPEVHSSDAVHWLLSDARAALGLASNAGRKVLICPPRRGRPRRVKWIVALSFDDTLQTDACRSMVMSSGSLRAECHSIRRRR